jgi:hypothetical protein
VIESRSSKKSVKREKDNWILGSVLNGKNWMRLAAKNMILTGGLIR